MKRRILYFINPISGTKSKDAIRELIEKKTREQNIPFEILPTRKDGNYAFLIDRIRKETITDIIICGGDGTVNQMASALQGIKVNLGILPMGSGNGLALAAGIPV